MGDLYPPQGGGALSRHSGTLFKTELRSFVPYLGHLTQYHALLTARMDCFLLQYAVHRQTGKTSAFVRVV